LGCHNLNAVSDPDLFLKIYKMEKHLNLLLADDDKDDRFFFKKVLDELALPASLTVVEDGEKLLTYLKKHAKKLPDILFLDLNMPRKNGSECLEEIKGNKNLKELPVIIYSTSLHEDVADLLYEKGAHYYIRKTDIIELKKVLRHVLTLVVENEFARPRRNKFILNTIEV
jgi:CheY-like chemotaxis protein